MNQLHVSVVIPLYNGEKTIVESLKSLLQQNYIDTNPDKVEIIVIDDNSNDNSYALF